MATRERVFRRNWDLWRGWTPDRTRIGCPNSTVAWWRCRRRECLWCFEAGIYSVARAIGMSNPDVFFGIDKVSIPDSYPQDHLHEFLQDLMYRMKDHVERNLSRLGRLRWCWIAEFYSDGEGVHIHGYLHDIPGVERAEVIRLMQAYIDLEDPNAGLPRARKVWHEPAQIRNGMADYILKGRKLREMDITEDEAWEAMRTYRLLNGRGMVHTSRAGAKFYRDPATGHWITQTKACSLALEEWHERRVQLREADQRLRAELGYGHNLEVD